METGEEWSLHATSADFKRLFESLGIIVPEDKRQPSFAKCLLTGIQCSAIVDEINRVQREKLFYLQIYPVKELRKSQNQFMYK